MVEEMRFDEIYFDESYFDYDMDIRVFTGIQSDFQEVINEDIKTIQSDFQNILSDIGNITMVEEDFEYIMLREGADWFWITKSTYTTNSLGEVTNVSEETYNIYGRLESNPKDNLKYASHGNSYSGICTLFFKKIYTDLQTDFSIEIGDILTDRDFRRWKIIELSNRLVSNSKVFGKATLQKIGEEK